MKKKILGDNFDFEQSGDIIDQIARQQDKINKQKEAEPITLNEIVTYYHKKIYEKKEVINYLTSLDLKLNQVITRLKISYSDGSIKDKISNNQKKSLISSGYLNPDETDTLCDCLIFAFYDEAMQVTGMHGLSIYGDNTINYGNTEDTFFNNKALSVYDEVILTNNILECLSFLELGFDNVVFNPDFNGHLVKLLQDKRVKQVITAYSKDDFAKVDLVTGILTAEDIEVKVIFPAEGFNSWNEMLKHGYTKDLIQTIINDSNVLRKKNDSKEFHVEKQGFKYIFTIQNIKYSITGVKEGFISNLRVNIKAEYEGEKFPDNLDLYSARSRASFSSAIANLFNIEPKRIEKDLLKILDHLEDERDRQLNDDEPDAGSGELTEEERKTGLEFLQDKNIFNQVIQDMTALGYVGEDLNKLLAYLCASSRKLDDPISLLIISQSGSGKSYLIDTVKKLIPGDEVINIHSLSDQALNYLPDLTHKFLCFGEAMHSDIIEHQVREMLSSKELSRLVTVKDQKTGAMTTNLIKKKVIVSSMMSTTNHRINPENASRFFIINTDETESQTIKIRKAKSVKYSFERIESKKETIPQIINKHKTAQRLLKKITIINTFAKYIDFPDWTPRSRRDFERFIDLIAVICFIRQYQKEVKKYKDIEYIECDLEDYKLAYDITIGKILKTTLHDLPAGAYSLYKKIRKMIRQTAKRDNLEPVEVTFIQRDIREYTKLGGEFIKKHLRLLVDYEYIILVNGKNKGTRYSYKIRCDEEIGSIDVSLITSPEELKRRINEIN